MDIRSLLKKPKIKEVIEYKDNNYFVPGEYLVIVYDNNSYTLLDKDYNYLDGKNNQNIKSEISNITDIKTLSTCSSEGENITKKAVQKYNLIIDGMGYKLKKKYDVKLTYDSQIYYYKPGNELYDNMMKDYEKTLGLFKKRCEELNISYEENVDKLVFDAVKKLDEKEFALPNLKPDISYCYSIEKIDEKIDEMQRGLSSEWDYEKAANDIKFISGHLANYPSDFFNKTNRAIVALAGKDETDKEIVKKYTEFLISLPKYIEIMDHVVDRASNLSKKRMQMRKDRFHSKEEFIEEINNMISHDPNSSEFLYHVPQCEEDAKNILNEGLYMYSDRMSSTTLSELTSEELLIHGYGSDFQYFEDYIVVIDKPINEDIIEEIPEEIREPIKIYPRRSGLVNKIPTYVIPSQYIVGYIDKEHMEVVYNPNYKKIEKNNSR